MTMTPTSPDNDLKELQQEVKRLREQVQQQSQEIARLEELAATDPLTGVDNRRSFDKHVRRWQAEFQRHGRVFSLMFIDIDDFKPINDVHGHQAGDQMLIAFATTLQDNLRASDVVYRIGGDEFAVLLPGTHANNAVTVANRCLETVRQTVMDACDNVEFGLSIGIAESSHSVPVEGLIRIADQAMYNAKNQGGNRFTIGKS